MESLAAAWPTVGRGALIDRIVARAGSGGGVVLTGPPGVGKSQTARVAAAQLVRSGAVVEWVQGTESTANVPLGAFSAFVPAGAGTGAATPLQLLWQAAAAMLDRARRRQLVLVVDDAHLLDDASATLVQQLRDSPQVFLLATVRTGERMPDAIVSLWKDGDVVRLDVAALEADEVGEILQTALGGPVEEATTQRLWAATGGNPLFLHELVLAGLRSESLASANGRWRWRGPLSGDGGIVTVLEARLASLDKRERAALEVLAIGEPLGVDLFEGLVGIEVVDRLERQELVRVRRDDRREEASLFHPLYRDVLRHATPPERAAATREMLARAVERAGGRRRGDLLRVALWRLDARELGEPAVLTEAAAEAQARFDLALAERLARAAVDAGGGAAAWHALASALRGQGRYAEADMAWATAVDLEPDPGHRVALARSRSANLFFGARDADAALTILDAAFPDATTQLLRDSVGSLVALFDLYRGRVDAALATAVPIIERGAVEVEARVDAALAAASAYAFRGRAEDAVAVIDAFLPLALQHNDVGSIESGALMASRIMAVALDGRLQEALDGARNLFELAVDMGTHDGIAGLGFAIGQLHEIMGEVDAARRMLGETADLLRENDRNGYLPWCLAGLAHAALEAGAVDDARTTLADLDEVAAPELRLFQPLVDSARLLLAAVDGDAPGAAARLVETGRAAADDGHVVLGAMVLHAAVRIGHPGVAADALGRLAMSTGSRFVHALAAHARASATRDGHGLDRAADDLERVGALLLAAEAAADAAVAHRAAGDHAPRLASGQRHGDLLARCPGAAPPWLAGTEATPDLSAREREVAELAATGLPSRVIAERLFVSVRTVDNHLYRVYTKLGVSSREELAVVLGLRRQGE